jgi:hypothetical protein
MANLLTSSTRRIPKATYVPLQLPAALPDVGRAILKFGYIRQLKLQPGEVDAVQKSPRAAASEPITRDANFWSLLRAFEGTPLPAQLPSPSAFAGIPESQLIAFGKALVAIRSQAAAQPKQAPATAAQIVLSSDSVQRAGSALNLLNAGIVANNAFVSNISATPIGTLNLERLEMTPAGIERGELLATIPLAPKERTSVVQKEWSVTNQEFTSIVTDSLENYSETGVTENTELAQSTNSQTTHSNQFNVNATASGSFLGFVSGSSSTQFGTQDQTSKSAADSRKDAINTTRKASSRVKQSHKITISTTTVTGTSETTTRTLENPSATDPIRIDYFSLMRKWHVSLYRFGLRLTYDIAVPAPGAAMRAIYEQLAQLQCKARQDFSFPVAYTDITPANYPQLASQYGAQVPPPPASAMVQIVGGPLPNLPGDGKHDWVMGQMNVTVPDGYAISDVKLEVMLSNTNDSRPFYVLGSGQAEDLASGEINHTYDLTASNGFMASFQGSQTITYFVTNCSTGSAVFTITQAPTSQTIQQWTASVWNALYNAAQATFYTQQQSVNAEIASLQNKISSVDTLTLRREENEEIMKCVLQWLLGPGFDFMLPEVVALYNAQGKDALTYGVSFTGNELNLSASQWTAMFMYQEMVKFINEAIEWENVIYYLYSYFWDVPTSWSFIRQIQHPDATRQAFLRAGSARVVLTVRPGFEQAWASFVELGDFGQILPPGHPYFTIAQQIQAYNNINYPGIPPANPNGGGPVDDNEPQVGTTCAAKLQPSTSPVEIPVADSTGFKIGATAIIDNWDKDVNPTTGIGVQEIQAIVAVLDSTHITVQSLNYPHDGTSTAFPVVQAGEKGVLIGEWFEYTPTSGTDIAVTSNLATIS